MKISDAPKHKRLFFYALLALCLGIWGYVFFQMSSDPHENEKEIDALMASQIPMQISGPAPVAARAEVRYDSSFRDPFASPVALFALTTKAPNQSAPSPEPKPPAAAPMSPPLTLSGIVGATALLHDKAGVVHIGRAGDRAGAVQILEVRHDHVVIHFEGRSHTLRLMR